jgi:hypothetical protein
MGTYLLAIGIILMTLLVWVLVQHIARLFAARHPELGAYREAGGCGGCGCGATSCERDTDEAARP